MYAFLLLSTFTLTHVAQHESVNAISDGMQKSLKILTRNTPDSCPKESGSPGASEIHTRFTRDANV